MTKEIIEFELSYYLFELLITALNQNNILQGNTRNSLKVPLTTL